MFKKLILMSAMVLAAAFSSSAQEKPRMYINDFEVAGGVSDSDAAAIRQAVIDAINKTQRFELATSDMESALSQEIQRRSSEAAMHDDATRNEILMEAGCKYVMSGNIIKCTVESTRLDNGSISYSCVMSYSVTVAEVATSTTVATQKFDSNDGLFSGAWDSATSADGAKANAVKRIEKDIEGFIVEYFPLDGTVIPMDYEVKKDKVLSCYISLGTGQGIKTGDIFAILAPKVVIGQVTYSEIGRVKVEEVVSDAISRCKVTKGQKELFSALENFAALDEASQSQQPIKIKAIAKTDILGEMDKLGL
ncbi:MAG: hypothetical protein IAB81_03345 [Bacteroidetes bacterium]|uniref:Curli production assembly/transport component CsgG n=1 Tax=Candidatus Merdivivens pullicola TaxID=2840872 RepID=A0A9D9IHN8_9BACT|nr:hypothetical protein [Candidatus Merdivivens pullicola]